MHEVDVTRPAEKVLVFFWWLKRLIYLWVKSICMPEDPQAFLDLDPNKPVCYILRYRSYTDLLILDHHCELLGLPRPLYQVNGIEGGKGTFLYLAKAGIVQKKRDQLIPAGLTRLVELVAATENDIQLVPVSVFWGRNPGKEEKSLFKLLFFDDEHGGVLQRFFVFFAHGKSVFCNFGRPISVSSNLLDGKGVAETTKKIRRVLKVHFRRQREAVLGPHIYDPKQVIEAIVRSRLVRSVIEKETYRQKSSIEKVQGKARRYAEEITARISYSALRVYDIILSWLWRKIYSGVEVRYGERPRDLAATHELVYMPCHRSHMDYLLIAYVIYYLGLMPPHTAAGVNLNFWPIGSFLRRGGGFFIRRTFGGNRLYSAVFTEYVHYLLSAGFPLSFYPEGGRSRSGLLLKPKTGMLSMVLQSFERDFSKPIAIVPVFICYDKLMEGRSYLKELRGRSKKSESLGQLIKARKVLRSQFGKAYIAFGEPIDLAKYLDGLCPGWRELPEEDSSKGGKASSAAVATKIATDVMMRITQTAYITPISIFSLALVSVPKNAMNEKDLLDFVSMVLGLLKEVPYSRDISVLEFDPKVALGELEKFSGILRFEHPGGDVIYLGENERFLLTYYRNNILPHVALPSLLASFFHHNEEVSAATLIAGCADMYQFIKDEFFMHWEVEECKELLGRYLAQMVKAGLLLSVNNGETIRRTDVKGPSHVQLNILGNVLGETLERYAIFSLLLSQHSALGAVKKDAFEEECRLMSQRLRILNGSGNGAFFDKNSYRSFIDLLHSLGYIEKKEDELKILQGLNNITDKAINLLHSDIRSSILRTT